MSFSSGGNDVTAFRHVTDTLLPLLLPLGLPKQERAHVRSYTVHLLMRFFDSGKQIRGPK